MEWDVAFRQFGYAAGFLVFIAGLMRGDWNLRRELERERQATQRERDLADQARRIAEDTQTTMRSLAESTRQTQELLGGVLQDLRSGRMK